MIMPGFVGNNFSLQGKAGGVHVTDCINHFVVDALIGNPKAALI